MSDEKFVKADIVKLERFVTQSQEAINEFNNIRNEFDRINNVLLSQWEGKGKESYQQVARHITENIGGIKDILDTINNNVLQDIIDQYNKVDDELGEYNRNAGNQKKG